MCEQPVYCPHQLCEESCFVQFLCVLVEMVQVVLQFQSQRVVVAPHNLQNLRLVMQITRYITPAQSVDTGTV